MRYLLAKDHTIPDYALSGNVQPEEVDTSSGIGVPVDGVLACCQFFVHKGFNHTAGHVEHAEVGPSRRWNGEADRGGACDRCVHRETEVGCDSRGEVIHSGTACGNHLLKGIEVVGGNREGYIVGGGHLGNVYGNRTRGVGVAAAKCDLALAETHEGVLHSGVGPAETETVKLPGATVPEWLAER